MVTPTACLCEGLAGSLFYGRNAVLLPQHIDHHLEEQGFLTPDLQLLFERLDPLLREFLNRSWLGACRSNRSP
jgi:hypothetical protein